MSPASALVRYVDTLGLALPSRCGPVLRSLRAHARVVETQRDRTGRRHPSVRVRGRLYPRSVHVHQPDDVALDIVRRLVSHGRAGLLRADLALDLVCESEADAAARHEELRRRAVLAGARGRVRVHPDGTTYVGVAPAEEGACLVAYSDARAAAKNCGRPTLHAELRFLGSRAVYAALGSALNLDSALDRVRIHDAPDDEHLAARFPGRHPFNRLVQNREGDPLRAHDVARAARLVGLDPRAVLGRGRSLLEWASASRKSGDQPDAHAARVRPAEAGRHRR